MLLNFPLENIWRNFFTFLSQMTTMMIFLISEIWEQSLQLLLNLRVLLGIMGVPKNRMSVLFNEIYVDLYNLNYHCYDLYSTLRELFFCKVFAPISVTWLPHSEHWNDLAIVLWLFVRMRSMFSISSSIKHCTNFLISLNY